MKLLGLALSLVIGFASSANASILVEPYAGYGLGNYEDGPGEKGTMNSPVLGARVGGEMAVLFIAADYSIALDGKSKAEGSSTTEKFDSSQLYGVIGANLPLLRAWVGYGLMNEVSFEVPGDEKASGGTHIKLGVGFKLIPMVSLNLEYLMADYKETESLGVKSPSELEVNTVLLSASIPFSF